jgi:hypothetical protein
MVAFRIFFALAIITYAIMKRNLDIGIAGSVNHYRSSRFLFYIFCKTQLLKGDCMKEDQQEALIRQIVITQRIDVETRNYILRFEIPFELLQLGSIGLGRKVGEDLKFIAELMYRKALQILKEN